MSEKREKARLVNWGFRLEFLNTTLSFIQIKPVSTKNVETGKSASATDCVGASQTTTEASDACDTDVVHYSHVILDNRIGCTQKFFSDLHFVSFKDYRPRSASASRPELIQIFPT